MDRDRSRLAKLNLGKQNEEPGSVCRPNRKLPDVRSDQKNLLLA